MNKLPKCSSFQLYLQFFDKYYLALYCLFGLSKCSSFQLYLHKQHNNAQTVHKQFTQAHKAKTVDNNAIKSDVPLLKSRITKKWAPKHRHFPTNTYQHRFRPTHINTKILPTPT